MFSGSCVVRDGSEIPDVFPLRKGSDEGVRSSAEPESYGGSNVCDIREYMQGLIRRTSTQQRIPWFDVLDGLINRIPNLAFAGYRSTRRGVQKPKCLRRPGCLHLRLVCSRDARTVRNCGRMSGYRLEEHFLRGGDRYGSSSKDGVQSTHIECPTDHVHGPVRSNKSDEIIVIGLC